MRTSNEGFEDRGGMFGDDIMAADVIDRPVHHCHVVTICGNSYSMRQHTGLWQALHDQESDPTPDRQRRKCKAGPTN